MNDTSPGCAAAFSDARPTIRLQFVGFWDGFDPHDNFFTRLLGGRYRLELCDDPEYIIFAYVGKRRRDYRRYDCVRIFYTGENIPPDWSVCDWASRPKTGRCRRVADRQRR